MARPKFSTDEFKPTGKMYPGVKLRIGNNNEIPSTPVLNKPIGSYDNFKLIFEGKKPYWIPVVGSPGTSDTTMFRPRINPDNVANHQLFDGGPRFPYEDYPDVIHSDWFDLKWQWVDSIGGATVYPGNPKVPDMTNWEEYTSIPDLDKMDWETCAKQNVDYLATDRMNQLGIQCGLWERLMALMDVVEACIALVDEDQKDGVHRFFDKYADFLIGYIGRMKDVCDINSVMLHEDWAHQMGPFISPDTAREMLLPYLQRIVDYVHSRGMLFEIHCCGDCKMLVPLFIESGADMWNGQPNLNDMGGYAKQYKDSNFVFGVMAPDIVPEVSYEDMRKAAREWVDEYKDYKVAVSFMRPLGEPVLQFHPKLREALYEYSRIAYQDED